MFDNVFQIRPRYSKFCITHRFHRKRIAYLCAVVKNVNPKLRVFFVTAHRIQHLWRKGGVKLCVFDNVAE